MIELHLEDKTVEGVLNYLAGRPWREVNELIVPLLQQLEAQKAVTTQGDNVHQLVPVAGADG